MLSVTPNDLMDLLLNVGPVRPVFIWGPPGIGKSALVEQYARRIGLPCISLVGSQLAPEDLIGVPQIDDGRSYFCPPRIIAQEEPYVLFLDELNASSPDVQKAFYSLIHDRRIGEYTLPEGSVVIGAGNRKSDKALARPIASALVNRLIHVELQANVQQWIAWGEANDIHPSILQYVATRPDQLLAAQADDDAPFSTPRSWHMLSDALQSCRDNLSQEVIQVLAAGCLSSQHAGQFTAFARNWLSPYSAEAILAGELGIPYDKYEEATFMLASVRAFLIDRLPAQQSALDDESEWWVLQAIELIEKLAEHDVELVRYFLTPPEETHLPAWFVDEITQLWADILGEPKNTPRQPESRSRFGRERPTSPFGSRTPPPPPPPGSTRFGRPSNSRSSLLHQGLFPEEDAEDAE